MKNNIIYLFLLIIILNLTLSAQDIKIGAQNDRFQYNGGFYDFSDPRFVNISVSIWGYVRFPGKYYVPENTKLLDLISYAGGPLPDAYLDDIRLLRTTGDQTLFDKFNIESLMEDEELKVDINKISRIRAGDLILVPGQPKYYFRDYISIISTVTGTLISLATFLILLTK